MKTVLEFSLPDELQPLRLALAAGDLASILTGVRESLRLQLKHGVDNNAQACIESTHAILCESLGELGLEL